MPTKGILGPSYLEWLKLFVVDEGELCDEVVEVLVARVDVRLGSDGHEAVEVVHVHVDEHAVESRQDLRHRIEFTLQHIPLNGSGKAT